MFLAENVGQDMFKHLIFKKSQYMIFELSLENSFSMFKNIMFQKQMDKDYCWKTLKHVMEMILVCMILE